MEYWDHDTLPFGTRYWIKCPSERTFTRFIQHSTSTGMVAIFRYFRLPASESVTGSGRKMKKPVRWIVCNDYVPWYHCPESNVPELEYIHIKRLLQETPNLCLYFLNQLQEINIVWQIIKLYTELQY
jgi:hypothetical protein